MHSKLSVGCKFDSCSPFLARGFSLYAGSQANRPRTPPATKGFSYVGFYPSPGHRSPCSPQRFPIPAARLHHRADPSAVLSEDEEHFHVAFPWLGSFPWLDPSVIRPEAPRFGGRFHSCVPQLTGLHHGGYSSTRVCMRYSFLFASQ